MQVRFLSSVLNKLGYPKAEETGREPVNVRVRDPLRALRTSPVIVCQCNRVTDKEINALVDQGYVKYVDIQRLTDAGTTCGSCAPRIVDVIFKRRPDVRSI